MTKLDKVVAWIIAALFIAVAFAQTYHAGKREGRRATAGYYEGVIARRVDQGIKGYRRVAKIREQSEYRRGFETGLTR